MIRKLKKKIIVTVMAVALIMTAVVLGVVLYFSAESMELQSISMMRAIAAAPFQQGTLGQSSEETKLPFFMVQISSRGELIAAGGGFFQFQDRDSLQQIINAALESPEETGKLGEYDLRFLKTTSPGGFSIVFADTSTEAESMKRMATGCLWIFLGAGVAFLGIGILLSRWAAKPVTEAWQQQKQFVADASHELKTPLSVILANGELLETGEASEEERKKFSGNVLTAAYQMRGLVEDLLEMARVDGGREKMTFAPVDFSQMVADAALSFQLLYEEKGMGLRCAAGETITLSGSEKHLYQVLDVLLDNALKYSDPGSMVSVDLRPYGKDCLLSVASPGAPLSPEERKAIFKRFYRGDRARTMNGSYGLGLSIAEAVVEAHGGRIWAESREGYNLFYVQLPVLDL